MESSIGIKDSKKGLICQELNKVLANIYVLYAKTQAAHWNVEGPDFMTVHTFLGDMYDMLSPIIDSVAERIRVFGVKVSGKLADMLSLSVLSEEVSFTDSQGIFRQSVLDIEVVVKSMRLLITRMMDEFGDEVTANFLMNIIEQLDKIAWFFRAHIK
jgi:starvation-inducible DNA-binding protein